MTIDRTQHDRLQDFARKLAVHDPEDLVQDTWLRELEDPDDHGEPYLRRSLKYRWQARHRSDSRRRRREATWASARSEHEVAPVELLALQRALSRLSIEQRRLVEARFIEGREPREIAAALGLTPEAVRQRLHRALLVLRRELDSDRRRGLVPLGWWRRLGWWLGVGVAASSAIVAVVCVDPGERAPGESTVPSSPASAAPERPATVDPVPADASEPEAPARVGSQSVGADLLGAAWLIREYRDGYLALIKEVQASFIECVAEHNRNPPDTPVEMTGKTVFRVQLRSDPETGVFAEAIETREDSHAARALIECIRESLPTLEVEVPALEVPPAVLVVVHETGIMTTLELDLGGMPEDLRDDVEQLRRIGRYLSKGQAPASAEAALAELALALADGVIEADELDEHSWTILRGLEDPPNP